MGALISRFRKSKTTVEILEEIDKSISHLEKFRKANQELRQKVIGKLILYSVVLYIGGAFALYFFFMPQEWTYRIYGLLPFLLFPFLVYLLKRFLHWFFVRKISQNEEELQVLREKRKDILENVMETETYKKAKEILEKFDPETKRKIEEEKNRKESDEKPKVVPTQQPGLRRRNVPNQPVHPGSPVPPVGRGRGMVLPPPSTPNIQAPINGQAMILTSPVSALPRPILPLEKTPLDKLMDYMIGDGAQHRYALICRNCSNHNGMALKEEFEYLAFRCAYCRFFNPARKQRPNAPRLPVSSPRRMEIAGKSDTEGNSSNTSESEEVMQSRSTIISQVDSSAMESTPTNSNLPSSADEEMDVEAADGPDHENDEQNADD